MILKGNQRGGARQMALHLMNGEMNEHVELHEIRGFVSENIMGALNEIYAVSKGTQDDDKTLTWHLDPWGYDLSPLHDLCFSLYRDNSRQYLPRLTLKRLIESS